MTDLARISEITKRITGNISTIEQHLSVNRPSDDFTRAELSIALQLPPLQAHAREQILDDMDQLHSLLLGPLPYLMRLMSPAVNIMNSLQAIYRFKIAQKLGVGETVSYADLAHRCSIPSSDLRRFLRLAIAYHVFDEPQKDMVCHNSTSKILAGMSGFEDWMGLVVDEMWPASVHSIDAMIKWPMSTEISHTGFTVLNQSEVPFFDTLNNDPARALRFANGMRMIRSAPPFDFKFLLDNLDWSQDSGPKSVVEVGGSQGSAGYALLERFPWIESYVVQDVAEVVHGVEDKEKLPYQLKFKAYDFFTEQIHKNADVYFFRLTLHNWPDETAIQILKNQVPALRQGSVIILNEICLPEPKTLTGYQEQFLRGFDLSMKHINNGKEREAEEWSTLIAQVDSRLKIESIISPPGSMLSVICISFQPDAEMEETQDSKCSL